MLARQLPTQLTQDPASRKLMVRVISRCYLLQMIIKTIFGGALALGLTTFATAGYVSIASIAGIETVDIESGDTGSNPDDIASLETVLADVLADKEDALHYSNQDSRYHKHVGLGFALSRSNGSPLNGGCDGNGHLSNPTYENQGNRHPGCGEPSPSD